MSLTVEFDFPTLGQNIDVDLQPIQLLGDLSSVQALYIDNSANTSPLVITCNGTNQRIVIPPQSCGYVHLLVINPAQFLFHTTGAFVVPVQFLNYFVPTFIWSAVSVKGT
jgi:hypothetical protein